MNEQASPDELLDRVQRLTEETDQLSDPRARELTQELMSAVLAMYGDGLTRIVAAIGRSREAGATILDELAQDGAVASLLLIHDLYPVSLEDRVVEALDTVRPYMESHGGNVEFLGIEDGVAKLALQGSCNGCAASRATLELAIKQALEEHAPDLDGLEVQGVSDPVSSGDLGGSFELPMFHSAGVGLPMVDESPPARWVPLQEAGELSLGELRAMTVEGAGVLVANVDGSLLAYRDECAACGESLQDGELTGPLLRCASCGADFDLPRAGRAAGGEPLQLTPVPLLATGGVRVAV
jgi:Fe-S cluster biogenesis protein NfuA/nitrite reductase/ring-hydroxylating ferredoxin subunit